MNRKDLVEVISKKAETTKIVADRTLNSLVKSVVQTLKTGEDVTLVGFGCFKVVDRSAREGRNPQTGEKLTIPARKALKFTAGKALKDAINEK